MKNTVSKDTFIHTFSDIDRKENFSYDGRAAMFEHFEELENDCDTEIEFDPIAICCEYSEYSSAINCIEETGYDFDLSEYETDEEKENAALEYLNDNTTVIQFDNGIIIINF